MASVRDWKASDFRLFVDDKARRYTWRTPDERIHGEPINSTFDYRPLVVIDPEDREQAQQLMSRLLRELGMSMSTIAATDKMQAALRKFANPTPPIEEPKSVGAVVEDDKGRRWVFTGDIDSGGSWWLNATEPERWPDINVTRILSEGVPAEVTA